MGLQLDNRYIYLEDLKIDKDNIHHGAEEILSKVRSDWCMDNVKIKSFEDGINNYIYGCYLEDDTDWQDMLLIRIYKVFAPGVLYQQDEIDIMVAMNRAGLGPPVYCKFQNGFCYGYVQGSCPDVNTLLQREDVWKPVVKLMVKIHKTDPRKYCPETKIMDRPVMHQRMYDAIQVMLMNSDDVLYKEDGIKDILPSREEMKTVSSAMVESLLELKAPVVLCHNDPNPRNIVFNEATGDVTFIDWEGIGMNFEAFDVASYFASFSINGNDSPPSKEYILTWLKEFLHQKFLLEGKSPDLITDRDIRVFYVQVQKATLLTYLVSLMLSVSVYSSIPKKEKYLCLVSTTLRRYYALKDEIMALEL